ncbi:hypothetical protein K466DRAFT_222074 [Polyporus arcularius HHB13444]|uniref:Uncharacterized protein n=1 Tax=Polyporus arcularius HHB13444 TaxID=1314778 RepID=A0A5C3P5L7_9APHY|nr:hypothetical protein K466DRAFT_222074 [Polyporus arcularius HHB13444]
MGRRQRTYVRQVSLGTWVVCLGQSRTHPKWWHTVLEDVWILHYAKDTNNGTCIDCPPKATEILLKNRSTVDPHHSLSNRKVFPTPS